MTPLLGLLMTQQLGQGQTPVAKPNGASTVKPETSA